MRKEKFIGFKLRFSQVSSGKTGIWSQVCVTLKPRFLTSVLYSVQWCGHCSFHWPSPSQDGVGGIRFSEFFIARLWCPWEQWEFVACLIQFISDLRQYSYSDQTNKTKQKSPHLFSHWTIEVHCMVLDNPDKFLFSSSVILVCFQ